MNSIIFIVPHFGKFNNYFQLWLNSCKFNPTINWLLFTDDNSSYNYPPNVKVYYTSFDQVVKLIQNNFSFEIILENPYQLCEFKITYGEVFKEHLKGFDFWGHCDTDVIWGDLRRHIPDQVLSKYSKISWRGHLTLYRNNDRINSLYRTSIDGVDFYKYACANNTGYPFAPDERAVNYIFKTVGEEVYDSLIFADLKIRSYQFQLLHFPSSEAFKNEQQIFLWNKGSLKRLYIHEDRILTEDIAYIHFLKRPMKVETNINYEKTILIVPNKFVNLEDTLTIQEIKQHSGRGIYWSYLFSRISYKYFISKISYWKRKKLFKKMYPFLPMKAPSFQLPITNTHTDTLS